MGNPMLWVYTHWTQIIGWAATTALFYRVWIFFQRFTGYKESVDDALADLSLIKSNHLPHLQLEAEKLNCGMEGLRLENAKGFERLSNDLHVLLTRMP